MSHWQLFFYRTASKCSWTHAPNQIDFVTSQHGWGEKFKQTYVPKRTGHETWKSMCPENKQKPIPSIACMFSIWNGLKWSHNHYLRAMLWWKRWISAIMCHTHTLRLEKNSFGQCVCTREHVCVSAWLNFEIGFVPFNIDLK